MKKSERLNGIIYTLKERGKLSASQLADIYEVSLRTIYRDMDALSQLKVPLVVDEGVHGGYIIDQDYFIPSIQLEDQEVIMLLMILKLGDEIRLPSMANNYELLKGKLINVLKDATQGDVKTLLNHISFFTTKVSPKHYADNILIIILDAFMKKKQLEISYYHPKRDTYQNRQVSPQDLFYDTGGWYLSAYCHLRQERRVFRLDRINIARILEATNDHIGHVISSASDRYVMTDYTLSISSKMYRVIKDNDYFMDHRILDASDPMTIQVTTNVETDIRNLILSNPIDIEILKPESYKKEIQDNIKLLMQQYKEH